MEFGKMKLIQYGDLKFSDKGERKVFFELFSIKILEKADKNGNALLSVHFNS